MRLVHGLVAGARVHGNDAQLAQRGGHALLTAYEIHRLPQPRRVVEVDRPRVAGGRHRRPATAVGELLEELVTGGAHHLPVGHDMHVADRDQPFGAEELADADLALERDPRRLAQRAVPDRPLFIGEGAAWRAAPR
jgi:hypothetical protein